MNDPIDVIFSWVESDEAHRKKVAQYRETTLEDVGKAADSTRFASMGEIFYSVGSVLRFAPFVRTIFIVTDQQDPHLEEFVAKYFPDSTTKIKIIDHREIFRGYEQYLPVFNSRTIETMLWRIPDLSEKAVYFNDDFLLLRPIKREEWFMGDKIVISNAKWKNSSIDHFLDWLTPSRSTKRFSMRGTMYASSILAGEKGRYFRASHTPHPFLRSVFETFYAQHPETIDSNIKYRFRHWAQYSAIVLSYVLSIRNGKAVLRDSRRKAFYIMAVGRGDNYVDKKLKWWKKHNPMSVCVQSLDMTPEEDRKRLIEWLEGVILPQNTINKKI